MASPPAPQKTVLTTVLGTAVNDAVLTRNTNVPYQATGTRYPLIPDIAGGPYTYGWYGPANYWNKSAVDAAIPSGFGSATLTGVFAGYEQLVVKNGTGAVVSDVRVKVGANDPISIQASPADGGHATPDLAPGEVWSVVLESGSSAIAGIPPTITTDPTSQTVDNDADVTLSAAATGSATLSYQWRKDGLDITDATNATLVLNNVTDADQGSYDCVITNQFLKAAEAKPVTAAATLRVRPIITDVAVESGLTVLVTFSQAMGTGVTDAGNYAITGSSGQGTLANAPDAVELVSGNQYRLTWAAGEMRNGFDITVTATGMEDAEGDAVAPAGTSGTHVGGAIGVNPTVTVEQAAGQADPADDVIVHFTATFSEAVTGFDETDVTLGGTSGGVKTVAVTGGPVEFDIAVQGMTEGTLICSVAADVCTDLAGNPNEASTSVDNTILYDANLPSVVSVNVVTWRSVDVTFDEAVYDGATDPANYAISGSGNNSLATNPDSVVNVGGNTYRLTWTDGEMFDGLDITITVTNVFDAIGRPMGSQNFGTHVGGGIAPVHITGDPVSLTVNWHQAVPAQFTVSATGTAPLVYQWRKDGLDMADGGNISGASTAALDIASPENSDEAVYLCAVNNVVGNEVTSNTATLTVNDPYIATHPVSQSVLPHTNVNFSVEAYGSGVLDYRWSKDGTPLDDGGNISGASTASLDLTDVSAADNGAYVCTVTGADPEPVVSNAATLSVTDPAILTQPASITVDPDQPASFTVVLVTGSTLPVDYQWLKDGSPLANTGTLEAGNYTATLTIPAAQQADEGLYSCQLAGVDTIVSDAAELTVNDPPDIDSVVVTPTGGVVAIGAPAQFEVIMKPHDDYTPFSYQWKLNGVDLADGPGISGANAAVLQIAAAQIPDEGAYTCTVTNSAGEDTSDPVNLWVGGAPLSIDNVLPNLKRYLGEWAQFTVSVSGGRPPITYEWWFVEELAKANTTPIQVNTESLPVYNTMALFANEGFYTARVIDDRIALQSNTAYLDVEDFLRIQTHPQGASKLTNQTHTFNVTTSGGFLPLSYSWYKIGNPAVLGTTPSYTIPSLTVSDAGAYFVQISDSNTNVVVSNSAVLEVAPGTPVAGLIGLGLLGGMVLCGGAFVVRRRK
ncbi:MAG TPA: immunoglobulin domain-containing protein [Candidatus Hydrogenedentes bacterium]|nr:immunoglobulin domain-containing protein [Candidatus Hydrogenedentota bacterium]